MIQTALLSVSDKTGIIDFARELDNRGVQIISTGGTARTLDEAGIPITPIHDITGFPEMMDGRVKTLHPKIHGGLLALRDKDNHAQALIEHAITPIDLVAVNLYPFEQTIAQEGISEADAIEQIDIGGPCMVRASAKNHRFVTLATDPSQYALVLEDMKANDGATTLALRKKLALAAFQKTAAYDAAIAGWMGTR